MVLNYLFGDEVTPEERIEQLRKLAVKVEKGSFSRTLTDAELVAEEKSYMRASMDLERVKAEFKEVSQQAKAKIKGLSDSMVESLGRIKNQKREVVGQLYSIPNHLLKEMFIYDSLGELIDRRPLKPEELQSRAFLEGPQGETIANPDDPNAHIQTAEEVQETTLEEEIQRAEEGQPVLAGSAPAEEGTPGPRWDGEIAKPGSVIPEGSPASGPTAEEVGRPGNTGDPDWQAFEKKNDEEAAAAAQGNKPKRSRPKKKQDDEQKSPE